jgi:hypothetical protein
MDATGFDPDGLFSGGKPPQLYGKTKRIINLINNHGHEPREAIKLVTGNTTPNRNTVADIRQKAARYSLQRPAMVKLAHKVVADTLKGKADQIHQQKVNKDGQVVDFIEQIAPTHTNKLAAAAMVFDRAEPVIRQNVNLNGDLKDFMPVNLADFE